VLCRATSAKDAAILAERLRSRIESHEFEWKGERLPVTVSIGIATSKEAGLATSEQLIERADKRMYGAKQAGRNRINRVPTDPPADTETDE
jgi:diguanylate cyclase (GGDEF)-like protein